MCASPKQNTAGAKFVPSPKRSVDFSRLRGQVLPALRLPPSGDVWPETERKLWLQLLEGSFKLIPKDKSEAAN
jgi:hypothetical protein